jgi:hypothetical protein
LIRSGFFFLLFIVDDVERLISGAGVAFGS